MRATSSTRSISRVRSRRQLGGMTVICLLVARRVRALPSAVRIRRTRSGGTSMPSTRLQLGEAQRDRLAGLAASRRRRSRRRPARRRPIPESARSSGGWPNRRPPDRARARSDTTNRCAGSACGPCCGSRADRTRPLRSARSVVPRRDFGLGAAHHAAEGHRPLRRRRSRTCRARASYVLWLMATNVSPGRGLADDDLPAGQLGQVEGVQRLAALHQHVVGDVDHVVDRPRCRPSASRSTSQAGLGPTFTPRITRAV